MVVALLDTLMPKFSELTQELALLFNGLCFEKPFFRYP